MNPKGPNTSLEGTLGWFLGVFDPFSGGTWTLRGITAVFPFFRFEHFGISPSPLLDSWPPTSRASPLALGWSLGGVVGVSRRVQRKEVSQEFP